MLHLKSSCTDLSKKKKNLEKKWMHLCEGKKKILRHFSWEVQFEWYLVKLLHQSSRSTVVNSPAVCWSSCQMKSWTMTLQWAPFFEIVGFFCCCCILASCCTVPLGRQQVKCGKSKSQKSENTQDIHKNISIPSLSQDTEPDNKGQLVYSITTTTDTALCVRW